MLLSHYHKIRKSQQIFYRQWVRPDSVHQHSSLLMFYWKETRIYFLYFCKVSINQASKKEDLC